MEETYNRLHKFFKLIINSHDNPFPNYADIQKAYNKKVAMMIIIDIAKFDEENSLYLERLDDYYTKEKNITFKRLREYEPLKCKGYQTMLDKLAELAISIYFSSPIVLKSTNLLNEFELSCYHDRNYIDDLRWIEMNLLKKTESQL